MDTLCVNGQVLKFVIFLYNLTHRNDDAIEANDNETADYGGYMPPNVFLLIALALICTLCVVGSVYALFMRHSIISIVDAIIIVL